jgi:nucleotide-binding universal stress UspA family protein
VAGQFGGGSDRHDDPATGQPGRLIAGRRQKAGVFETVVIATDGSASAERAVAVALDVADRFDATVHALSVVDEPEVEATPAEVRADLQRALTTAGGRAVSFVRERALGEQQEVSGAGAADADVLTAVRHGKPAEEIIAYATAHDADVVATGTRGRHGEHSFLLGSVAEAIVRRSPVPVLTVRQLDAEEAGDAGAAGD